jgi:hypothetical protein
MSFVNRGLPIQSRADVVACCRETMAPPAVAGVVIKVCGHNGPPITISKAEKQRIGEVIAEIAKNHPDSLVDIASYRTSSD